MLPQELIRAKRDGQTLRPEAIAEFIAGLTGGSVGEGQAAAFAMAVFFQGMTAEERAALTRAMADSGTVLRWDGLDGPVLDKHSTGGVGDRISLMLAPIVAACGGYVPMISGRGLGHTGGTLDKLDSIPGYRTDPDLETFQRVVRETGCAVIGQTDDLAPADRRLYAIRDVTATVESAALITASILSKKLAAGLDGLVMDVKCGSGAFMDDLAKARELADALAETARAAGLPTVALITDMNQVLGRTAGNALEVADAVAFLTGVAREPRSLEVTLALAGEMLAQGEIAETPEAGVEIARKALEDGRAAEVFGRMVAALGGPTDLLERPDAHLESAPVAVPVYAETRGIVARIDARRLGVAVIELGGGRRQAADRIDHAVGLTEIAGIGETVGPDVPLAVIRCRDAAAAAPVADAIRAAYTLGDTAPRPDPVVIERRTGES
ncbi:thymidine phosphorylase [Thalassobaculum sp. OXR-137]|uniref:thymidine phosphorylase n=1 Tax=Thalassobaculum sp. OXR-137 TaxID=3100173 RepID=UPI002AC9476E|nr:thymidine phosphorylase [Thalassobaculum sp. OXR-137]WPZ35343.1 thymidine phosphorylase [Thalassobaculum sp. OXR-137]